MLRSTPARQRWQLLGPTSIARQLLPSEQVPAVDEVQYIVARAFSSDADDQTVLVFPIMVAGEELERIGCVAYDGQDGLDCDVREDVIGRDVTGYRCRRAAPEIEVELLQTGQPSDRLLAPSLDVRIRFCRGGHECSLRGVVCRCRQAVCA